MSHVYRAHTYDPISPYHKNELVLVEVRHSAEPNMKCGDLMASVVVRKRHVARKDFIDWFNGLWDHEQRRVFLDLVSRKINGLEEYY